jgi:hypothetical protein
MKRIVRDRRLTPEEVAKYDLIRKQVEGELPELIAAHHQRMAERDAGTSKGGPMADQFTGLEGTKIVASLPDKRRNVEYTVVSQDDTHVTLQPPDRPPLPNGDRVPSNPITVAKSSITSFERVPQGE